MGAVETRADLVSWLLVQIAEDERAVDYAHRYLASAPDADRTVFFGPARVLAECQAKRAILEVHEKIRAAYPNTTIETDPCCAECSAYGEYPGDGYPCRTLRYLALPYADRPGYDEAWRP